MNHHRAFTLIELLVVIGIIGILAGIVMASFSGGTESARSAKCLANMRGLAQAAIAHASGEHYYPYAGSHEAIEVDKRGKTSYSQRIGWISWDSQGKSKTSSSQFGSLPNISACCDDDEKGLFALTNGALWKYVGQSRDAYICPTHAIQAGKNGCKLWFSYAMNSWFGCDDGDDETLPTGDSGQKRLDSSGGSYDRRLLFAEIPFGTAASEYDKANSSHEGTAAYASSDGNDALDCVLMHHATVNGEEYGTGSGTAESIAFNHKSGKRRCAHVAFADGHVEKLLLPTSSSGISSDVLTALLCGAADVAFDGKAYSLANDGDK